MHIGLLILIFSSLCAFSLMVPTGQPNLDGCKTWRDVQTILVFLFFLLGRRKPAWRTAAYQDLLCLTTFVVPRLSPEAPHVKWRERPLSAEGGIMGEKWPVKFSLTMRLPHHCRVLLNAAKLRHGTDCFTSPPKEGMPRIFLPEKSDGFGQVWTRKLGYQRPAC
jgi:hypothetical protein